MELHCSYKPVWPERSRHCWPSKFVQGGCKVPQRTPSFGHSHRNVTFQPATVSKAAVYTPSGRTWDFIKEGFVPGGTAALTAVVARAEGQRSPARTLKNPLLLAAYTVSFGGGPWWGEWEDVERQATVRSKYENYASLWTVDLQALRSASYFLD